MYAGIRYFNLGSCISLLAIKLTSGFIVIQYTISNAAATDIPMAQPYIPPKIAKTNRLILCSFLCQ